MNNELAFSVSAACNILSASGYSYNEIESELIKLKEAGKIKDGYILSGDLPKIKSIKN
jgi:hypothetical protein